MHDIDNEDIHLAVGVVPAGCVGALAGVLAPVVEAGEVGGALGVAETLPAAAPHQGVTSVPASVTVLTRVTRVVMTHVTLTGRCRWAGGCRRCLCPPCTRRPGRRGWAGTGTPPPPPPWSRPALLLLTGDSVAVVSYK